MIKTTIDGEMKLDIHRFDITFFMINGEAHYASRTQCSDIGMFFLPEVFMSKDTISRWVKNGEQVAADGTIINTKHVVRFTIKEQRIARDIWHLHKTYLDLYFFRIPIKEEWKKDGSK